MMTPTPPAPWIADKNAPDWTDGGAACIGTDPEVFFPESNNSHANTERTKQALAICHTCPLEQVCGQYVLSLDEPQWGIWGGMTEATRDTIRGPRTSGGREGRTSFCTFGHRWTEETTAYTARGYRRCKACKRAQERALYAREKGQE